MLDMPAAGKCQKKGHGSKCHRQGMKRLGTWTRPPTEFGKRKEESLSMKYYYLVCETRAGIIEVEANHTEEAEAKLDKAFADEQITFHAPNTIANREYEDITEEYMTSGWKSQKPDASI
jgi:hypothetical protein